MFDQPDPSLSGLLSFTRPARRAGPERLVLEDLCKLLGATDLQCSAETNRFDRYSSTCRDCPYDIRKTWTGPGLPGGPLGS